MDIKEVKAIRDSQESILILMMWLDKVDWLINQAETLQKIAESWIDIEENGTEVDASDFYTVVQDILSDNEESKYPLKLIKE